MSRYTFFLEYGGGTYISQIAAPDPEAAVREWATKFDLTEDIEYARYFEADFKVKLIDSLDLNVVTAIEGISRTWAFSAYRLERPATIHLTQTVEDHDQRGTS